MSYCSLEEAFQSNIADTALPLSKHHGEEQTKLEKGKLKSRKHSSKRIPQEPSVIEPDRPAHRHKTPSELLSGSSETSSSVSSYLIGASDPGEDYFPYPTGAGGEGDFDKQFLLEPNWYEQFHDRMPNTKAETPQIPGWHVDGKSNLYEEITPSYGRSLQMNDHMAKINKKAVSVPAAMAGTDSDLHRRIDEIYQKMDQLEMGRAESNHSEIILFVMTGIFVLLLLDLLLKQGCRALGTIVTASALPHSTMMGGGIFNNPFIV